MTKDTKSFVIIGRNSGISGQELQPNSFAAFLAERGLLAQKSGIPATDLVAIDYAMSVIPHLRGSGLGSRHCYLLQYEPSTVIPSNYFSRRERQFGTLIKLGEPPQDSVFGVDCPQIWPSNGYRSTARTDGRLQNLVQISSDKLSLIDGELYSLRRQASLEIPNLHQFGFGWGESASERLIVLFKEFLFALLNGRIPRLSSARGWFRIRPNWFGQIGSSHASREEKFDVMSRYKFALVIENSREYMSEKLFDAFFSGCIPIYIGPKLQDFGIPDSLVIQAQPRIESILEAVEKAKKFDYQKFSESLARFLSDPKTRNRWGHENVYQQILNVLNGTEVGGLTTGNRLRE